jgi:inorganic triphosphatase YgiF
MREIELKLALAPGDEAALRASSALAGAAPSRAGMLALYFDTPRRELAQAHMALRLRRRGRRWVQTLKAGASGLGGMHARSEWEYERPGPSIDLALVAGTPLAALEHAGALHERLHEVFRVESVRTTWLLEPSAGARVEAVLDQGTVAANGRVEGVCEVEIESLEGDPAATFELASRLLEDVALRPSGVTKAERGYRLASGRRLQPSKAPEISLDAAARPAAAARIVIAAGLAQLQANEEGVLSATDPEFVHQARVALRRMRSALRIFRDAIGVERAEAWRGALGELGVALGGARDWDVFATETLPPVLSAFGDAALRRRLLARVGQRRRRERDAAREAIGSRRYAATVLEISRWLALEEEGPADGGGDSLADFAARVIRKRHKRLLSDAADLASLPAAERHRVRIDTKRLRYGVDAMYSLFPSKRVSRYIDVLVALQDSLGTANDAATAARLVAELDPPEAFALFARGWFAARAAGDPVVFAVLLESLAGTPRFWRRPKKRSAVAAS